VAGELTLPYAVLYLPGDGQRITVYQAQPGSPDHRKMMLLSE
jgi:hypothetical protein